MSVGDKDLTGLVPILSAARLLVLSLSALVVAGAASGQQVECSADPRNVLRFENCGFRSGIAGWPDLVGENAIANLVEGNPSPGSYQIDSVIDDEGDRVTTIHSPCALIAPSSTYELEARFKIVDPSDAVQCGFFVAGYSDDRCGGDPNGRDSAEIRVTGSAWASLHDTYVSRGIDSSMRIFAFCYEDASGSTFTMLMDNFTASGPISGSPIFSDGFESGDTSAWSKTVP
jgi:hypothetical protein